MIGEDGPGPCLHKTPKEIIVIGGGFLEKRLPIDIIKV
jgi:hypothetical protein